MVEPNKIPGQKPVLKMLVPLFPDERLVKESYFELDKISFLVFPQRHMSDFRVFNIFHNNEFLFGGKMPGGGQKYVRNEMTLALTSIRRTLVFVENSLSALCKEYDGDGGCRENFLCVLGDIPRF